MNPQVRRILADRGGVITWAELSGHAPANLAAYAARSGQLVRLLPRVWAVPARLGPDLDQRRRLRAALACAGPDAALSHTSALWVWRLPVPYDDAVHVMAPPHRRIRAAGIVAHRRRGFVAGAPAVVVRSGLPVTALEQSLVDAWPLLAADEQRAPVLHAVAQRMTTPSRVSRVLAAAVNLPQRRTLATLLDRLAAGCRSALELWGYEQVFIGAGLEGLRWQVPVQLRTHTVWLDVFDPLARTNFELDGAKYHSQPWDRERDLRRDAGLAAMGIQVVRFTHHRLTRDAAAVRREALAILAARSALRPTGGGVGR